MGYNFPRVTQHWWERSQRKHKHLLLHHLVSCPLNYLSTLQTCSPQCARDQHLWLAIENSAHGFTLNRETVVPSRHLVKREAPCQSRALCHAPVPMSGLGGKQQRSMKLSLSHASGVIFKRRTKCVLLLLSLLLIWMLYLGLSAQQVAVPAR